MKKIFLVGLLFLVSCGEDAGINGDINRLEKEITVTVKTVSTDAELRNLYVELTGQRGEIPDQYGFAQWNVLSNGEEPTDLNCQIYILTPKRKDDIQILTLGHEMAHCIWGTYHD